MPNEEPRDEAVRTGADISPALKRFLDKTDGTAPKPGLLGRLIGTKKDT